ncbi:MAG: BamA/TamA family outer membrane protein [Bacteroidia bacterium]|nr:BamA/TamA family outer membrane protein [Bacteroidia bacterium]
MNIQSCHFRLWVNSNYFECVQKYVNLWVFMAVMVSAWAQGPFYLNIRFEPFDKKVNAITYPKMVIDSIALNNTIKDVLQSCNSLAYLNAQIAQAEWSGDSLLVLIQLGQPYAWVKLRKGNVPLDILSAAGYREQQFSGQPFDPAQFTRKMERMLVFLENNGYPFASIKLDSIELDGAGISAALNLDPNRYIVFDTLDIRGDANIKKWYLQKYLGVKPGNSYSENTYKLMNSRLSQLPYIKSNAPAAMYFYSSKVMPVFDLQNRKASSVDGIIGFAPNTQTGSNAGRLLITGEANLHLQNIAGTGKSVDLNYRSFLGNSQELKLKFVFPYLFRSSLAFDYDLNLIKQDTSFLDVTNRIGLQYRFAGTDHVKVFYSIQTTTLISIDTTTIKLTGRLPEAADIRNSSYGIGYKFTRLDYYLNPRKGFSTELLAGAGIKQIQRNPTIEQLAILQPDGSTKSVYDTLQLRYIQYRLEGSFDGYIPLFKRAVLRTQAMGGHIASENLFVNELFRIGGIRSLKGFDEQAIFTSTYAIANIECRYLIQQNSNVLLFWNGAYYRNIVRSPVVSDRPFGFGAGANIETGSGVFSLFYALGTQQGNAIEWARAKVHFGFINYF